MYLKPIVHSFASWFVSGTKVLKKYEVNKYPAIQILLSYNMQKNIHNMQSPYFVLSIT